MVYIVFIPLIAYIGDWFHTDYGSAGVLSVFVLYVLPYGKQEAGKPTQMSAAGKFLRLSAIFCLLLYLYIFKWNIDNMKFVIQTRGFWMFLEMLPQVIPNDYVKYMLFSCISLFFLTFYNNKRGKSQRWLFYAAYPLHLLILGIIRFSCLI